MEDILAFLKQIRDRADSELLEAVASFKDKEDLALSIGKSGLLQCAQIRLIPILQHCRATSTVPPC